MRILRVWILASIIIFSVSLGWYISQPVVIGFSRSLNATISANQNAVNVSKAIEYGSIIWGPLLIIFILLWAIVSSQQRDVESVIYG